MNADQIFSILTTNELKASETLSDKAKQELYLLNARKARRWITYNEGFSLTLKDVRELAKFIADKPATTFFNFKSYTNKEKGTLYCEAHWFYKDVEGDTCRGSASRARPFSRSRRAEERVRKFLTRAA